MLKISSTCLLVFVAIFLAIQANSAAVGLTTQKFEGDMLLSPALQRELKAGSEAAAGRRLRRNAFIDKRTHWPGGIVHYYIAIGFTNWERNMIKSAMQHISAQTCIVFRQIYNPLRNYVYIRPGLDGCYSTVGYEKNRKNILNLKPFNYQSGHCFVKGIIVHELLHTLGIFHQQSATNRDDYVHILKENIQDNMEHSFDKYPNNVVTDFNVGYDYSSIMHYGLYAFSKNGKRTMAPLLNVDEKIIGQREALSSKDVAKIKQMYNCSAKKKLNNRRKQKRVFKS